MSDTRYTQLLAHFGGTQIAAPPPQRNNHRAWLAYWADELVRAIARAVANPAPTTVWDHDMLQVIRCARSAHGRAIRVRPSLREP